jgi:hypothetical protein
MKISFVGAKFFYKGGRTERQTDRQTDGYEEANSRFSQFCEKGLKTTKSLMKFSVSFYAAELA